ncbi:MAG TPA: SLC13 family permease [Verrucomicrobiae bacterium]|nr:SLC13 family permease [Verrucomicrobiae bacterium]
MTVQVGLLLAIVVLAAILFWRETISADIIAIGVLLALILTRLIPSKNAFAGFGSDAVIMILGLLIMTTALQRTGVIDLVGRAILSRTGDNPRWILLIIMLSAAGISAFISNTAATAFFLPVVIGIARKSKIGPSRLLMPLAFSSILTSSVTLVSTSTNIVISGMLPNYRMRPMGMFELAPAGVPVAIAGLLYMWFIGRRMIPDRAQPADLTEQFGVRPYLSEIVIQPGSTLADKTLAEAKVGHALGLTVLRIVRDKDQHLAAHGETALRVGDILLVEGTQENIVKIKDVAGIEIKADVQLADPDLEAGDMALVEGIILPGSQLIGRTLKRFHFRERTGLQVLGVNHHGQNVVEKISQVPLKLGDVLLLQGPRANLQRMHEENLFRLLNPIAQMEERRPIVRRAPIAIGIFVVVLALATFKTISFPVAAMLGVLLVFATRCITPEQAYARVEWKAVILIACMLALGDAMENTGTAKYLASLLVSAAKGSSPYWLLSAFFFLAVLLTQPMSNQAAAIVVLPIAIQTALQAGLNPRSFAMMVAIAASCSYLTPLEPSCLMVYGPGRYRFRDFLKVGAGLTCLIYAIAILTVPRVWPLHG